MKTARWWPWDLPSGGHQRRSVKGGIAVSLMWSGQVGLGDGFVAVGQGSPGPMRRAMPRRPPSATNRLWRRWLAERALTTG